MDKDLALRKLLCSNHHTIKQAVKQIIIYSIKVLPAKPHPHPGKWIGASNKLAVQIDRETFLGLRILSEET